MSAFTSKATGNWSAATETTWTQVGVPRLRDTVTINNTVTVDVNSQVGDGSTTVLTIAAGAILAIADGITLSVWGGIVNQAAITLGVASALKFIIPGTSTNVTRFQGTQFRYVRSYN